MNIKRLKNQLKSTGWTGFQGKSIDDLTDSEMEILLVRVIDDYKEYLDWVSAMERVMEQYG